jgi:subtilisin family serine protease
MPNYRAVSAGAVPPPPTPLHALKIATQNSFDYSSFIFVGITSSFAEWSDAHPQLGDGMTGFGRYYWRGFVDKTDGNYLVIFAMPTLLHEDERYYAMGEGGFLKRGIYAASRILITPDYHGHNTFNASEVFGRGIAQGISLSYYPSHDHTAGALAVKYGWAMGRDALTNVFREFWPDIATHVLHRHP